MHKKMFDGMQPEQFYQFLAAATTASTPITHHNTNTSSLPLSFSLHHNNNNNHAHAHNHHHHHFPTYSSSSPPQATFDTSPYHQLLHHPQFLPRNATNDVALKPAVETNDNLHLQCSSELPNNPLQDGVMQRSSLMLLPEIPWSSDEMLALFRIRSSMDNTWFPDFIWENVSRKLAELGFKRTAEKCKEKFEEETRSFNSSIIISNNCSNKVNHNNTNNNNNNTSNNNYRLFGELEELCNNNNNATTTTTNNNNNTSINGNNDHENDDGSRRQPPLPPPPPPPDVSEPHDRLLRTSEDGEEGDPKDEEERLGVDDDDDDEDDNGNVGDDGEQSVGDSEKTEEKNTKRVMRKRKRQKKFEMFKGFCEKIVNKMMAQQQQLHCKILQDMVKRDEEKIAKEEAWKRQEIERLEKELEFRANEQAVSGDRQAKILEVLNMFNNSSSSVLDSQSLKQALEKLDKVSIVSSSNSSILSQDSIISSQLQPTSSCTTTTTIHDHIHTHKHTPLVSHRSCPDIIPGSPSNENVGLLSHVSLGNSKLAPPMVSSSAMEQEASQNPNPNSPCHKFSKTNHTGTNASDYMTDKFNKTLESQSDQTPVVGSGKDDTGRRWPRDEVLALINIRCSLFNNNNNVSGGDAHGDKDNFAKGPLWERISQKMMELGYNRSAKRCKEKWENINKYFRKTKDLNKKRSIDSRTCPYFHQLSHLYNQGALVGPIDRPMNHHGSPENHSTPFSETQLGGSSNNLANDDTNNTMHASEGGNEGVVQVPRFDFEF